MQIEDKALLREAMRCLGIGLTHLDNFDFSAARCKFSGAARLLQQLANSVKMNGEDRDTD